MKKNQGTVRNANTEQKEDSWTAKSMKKNGRTQIADERHKAESPVKTSSIMEALQVQKEAKVSQSQ